MPAAPWWRSCWSRRDVPSGAMTSRWGPCCGHKNVGIDFVRDMNRFLILLIHCGQQSPSRSGSTVVGFASCLDCSAQTHRLWKESTARSALWISGLPTSVWSSCRGGKQNFESCQPGGKRSWSSRCSSGRNNSFRELGSYWSPSERYELPGWL